MTKNKMVTQTSSGKYELLERLDSKGGVRVTVYNTLKSLALAVYTISGRNPPYLHADGRYASVHWLLANVVVYSKRGKTLNILELHTHGQKALTSNYSARWKRQTAGYIRRSGPVPGVHSYRGGPSCTSIRTMAEKRLNSGTVYEEGEVDVRPSRRSSHLPNSWDGRSRRVERSWKAQIKGRKAWDKL